MITSTSYGQEWIMISQFELPYSINAFALDQDKKLYLGSTDGNIYRYDTSGKEEQLYSDVNRSAITLIEPWNRMKLFLFYRENQVIQILNRFVTSPQEFSILDLDVEFASLAAPGVDNSVWIYAVNYNELRKYVDGRLIFNTPLTNVRLTDPTHLRAYQNMVIVLDAKTGFYFFDQFGNYATHVPMEGATYFQILNSRIITYDGKDVISFDPFQNTSITTIAAPAGEFIGVMKADNQYIFIKTTSVAYYTLTP